MAFDLSHSIVVGQGQTAIATATYLQRHQRSFELLSLQPNQLPSHLQDYHSSSMTQGSIIWISPGIHPNHEDMKVLKTNTEQILDIDYFLNYTKSRVIMVSGTNGKSTVCLSIKKALEDLGFSAEVYGNYQPGLLFSLDASIDWVVLELSSFQLYRLRKEYNVEGVVLLNVDSDHLDWHASEVEYKRCKHKIRHYSSIVVSDKDQDINYMPYAHCLYDSEKMSWQEAKNKAAVKTLFNALQLEITDIVLPKLPYRQSIKKVKGKVIINDSKSTNLASTISAIEYVYKHYEQQPVLLVLAGIYKSGPLEQLITVLRKTTEVIIVGEEFTNIKGLSFKRVQSISMLKKWLKRFNGVILFSPAGSSYDQYTSYEDRGRDFDKLTAEI